MYSSISKSVSKGNISEIVSLKEKDPTFHWSSLLFSNSEDTCLHLACRFGYVEIVEYLLGEFHPKHVNVRNIDSKTPLHEAAQRGQYECIKVLISNGADVNAIKRSDWTPLMLACTKSDYNYVKTVQYLLNKGALLNVKNKDGWTALHVAARNSNPAILQLLLTSPELYVSTKTNNGRNALHISALHKNLENMKLLAGKLDSNSRDSSGNTPVHEAVLGGDIDVIDYLVTMGGDVKIPNGIGLYAIHLASGQGFDRVIHHLVDEYNFDINIRDLSGCTALHHACRKRHKSTMETLTTLGAQMNIEDNCGRLPKDYLSG